MLDYIYISYLNRLYTQLEWTFPTFLQFQHFRSFFVHPVLGTSAPQAFPKRRQAMVPRRGTMAMITALLGGSFQDGCKW